MWVPKGSRTEGTEVACCSDGAGRESQLQRTELEGRDVVEDGVEEANRAAGVADRLLRVPEGGAHLEGSAFERFSI